MTLLAASQDLLLPPLLRQRSTAMLRTLLGRLILVAVVTAMVAAMKMQFWWAIGLVLLATSIFPDRRKQIVLLATIGWVFLFPPINFATLRDLAPARGAAGWVQPAMWNGIDVTPIGLMVVGVLSAVAILFAYGALLNRFPHSPPARKPVLFLVLLLFALFAITQLPRLPGGVWLYLAAVAMAFNSYVWFFAFWIAENRKRPRDQSALATYAWRPFWGFTTVPFGKGATYLQSVEAKNDEELADTQIRGVKLLVLAAFWTAVLIIIKRALFGHAQSLTAIPHESHGPIPTYEMALDAMKAGHPYPWAIRWAALAGYFVMWVLYFTIFGHKIVGIARVAGFNLYRNTYKPHLATSIADFYNRIYYYFKELLVAFFFYPTYLRYFKKRPKVRLFIATLAAAGFGNVLFHYIRADDRILRDGLFKTAIFFWPYIFYGLLLGLAISISQLRGVGRRKQPPTGLRRIIATGGVWLFFCLICIIQEPNDSHGLRDYGHYFLSLWIP